MLIHDILRCVRLCCKDCDDSIIVSICFCTHLNKFENTRAVVQYSPGKFDWF